MLTDYHNHLEHGPLNLEYLGQFRAAAQQKGIASFGISEHSYRFFETKHLFSHPLLEESRLNSIDEYCQLFVDAAERGWDVRMGLELDYIPGHEQELAAFLRQYPFDYVIGSVHWLGDFGVDMPQFHKEWERRGVEQVYEAYFDQILALAEANLVDIIGHLDLPKIFGQRPSDKAFLLRQYERVAQGLAGKACIEISTAGLRKPVGEIYPAQELLQICLNYDIPIVLSSDAHYPHDVGADLDQAVLLAESVGYTQVMAFRQRRRAPHPLG